MKKHFIFFVALFFTAQMSMAASVTAPADIPAYWASVDGKSGATLWSAVSAATGKNFKSIGYNGLYSAYLKTDVYPADSVGKAGKIWDMYGECVFASTNTCGNYNGVCDCYNREHSIPQSWWGGGTNGIGNDIFHVLPTDGKINGVRSNYEYGEVNGGTNWRGNKYGSAGSWSTDKKTIASSAGETVNGSGNVFEPKPQYKGDWARGIMGTIVKWQQSNLTTGNNFFSGTYTASGYYGLTKKAVVLLMKWHREDPVSQKEIDRNNGIQQTQGNRNPFIDYPYLAEYIWGEHAGETIDMSKLMPSTDPEFIPGKSDGWRGEVGPTPGVVKFGVTWSVNGSVLRVDSIEQNKKPSALPEEPVSCSAESDVYMGWSNAAINGTTDEAPNPLFTKAADIPAVTEDVTYYAVFAKAGEGSSAPAVYIFDTDHQGDEWTNTATNKGSYWLLDQGKELTSPEIDLAGLASVQATLRTFGGTNYDQFAIAAGATTLGTITVEKGASLTDYTWTNTKSLSGSSKITFTCSNAGSNKGVGFSSVTINATGSGVVYSRYITTCQGTDEVEIQLIEQPAMKILVGGHIYIQTAEGLYTIQGQRVK